MNPIFSRMQIVARSLLFVGLLSAGQAAVDPQELFMHPPDSARPQVLWMWMGSTITRDGIDRDLRALKDAGYGGTTLFSLADTCTPWAGVIEGSLTPEVVAFSEPWWALVREAAQKSAELGLDFGMHNCPGYESSGGPWITPELSMQQVVWSEQSVHGPAVFSEVVARPLPDLRAIQPFPLYNPTNGRLEKPEIAARRQFYRDIAVLAVPAGDPAALGQVIDLTERMRPDGRVAWEAPAGEWKVYRFGYTTMGNLLQPGQWAAIGLECDKMNPAAVEFHLAHIIEEARHHLGNLIGKGFNYYHFDSYEAGTPGWTPAMREAFHQRRGYDLVPFLPTLAGRVVGSEAEVKKFKADFQQTIRDLYRENYFPVVARTLRAAGLQFMCEPYGGPWTIEEVVPSVDRIVTEFWTNGGEYKPYELAPTVKAVRKANRNLIEAEAFTGSPADSQWSETPAWLKSIGDAAFCDGVNLLTLHRFVHQPFEARYRPGLAMGQWGTHFDRTQTWWEPGKAWVRYLTRCQALLQWGEIAGLPDDFRAEKITGNLAVRALHRRFGAVDLYFVANLSRRAGQATTSYPITGYKPEIWDPVTGTRRDLSDSSVVDGRTILPLEFAASQSFFIVFRERGATAPTVTGESRSGPGDFPTLRITDTLSAAWTVAFDPKWGGPAKASFPQLVDWTQRPEAGIKYYSGTASYHTVFKLTDAAPLGRGERVWLDLGQVHDLAQVRLNGHDLGVIWTAPWRVDVTGLLKRSRNQLDIQVTNTWANRLIGDEQEPADCVWGRGDQGFGGPLKKFPDWLIQHQPRPSSGRYTFTTWNYFTKDSALRLAGLVGPVTVQVEERALRNDPLRNDQ